MDDLPDQARPYRSWEIGIGREELMDENLNAFVRVKMNNGG